MSTEQKALASQPQSITLGGGCFWCVEAAYELIQGIINAEPGYAGGSELNPTWQRVCTGTTGHAEVVRVRFDPTVISLEEVLEVFWTIHNPTTLNRQSYDVGTEYRSIILYQGDEQRQVAARSIEAVAKLWPDPIVTELVPLETFYPAEPYHRHYFKQHPSQAYCQIIINPKLQHLRERFTAKLKPDVAS